MEIATERTLPWSRSGQSDASFTQGKRTVLCKRKHGIATEVRDTNLRFSMIITTPANLVPRSECWLARWSKSSQATLDGMKKSRRMVRMGLSFVTNRVAYYQSFILQEVILVRVG
jgi:hypothetical protein